MTLSVIIPARDLEDGVRAAGFLPPGADEVIVQAGGGGVAHARNLGASRARGDILLFTDDDVRLTGDLAAMRDPPRESTWWSVSEYADATGDVETLSSVARMNAMLSIGAPGLASVLAVRAPIFHRIGGYDPTRYYEDVDLALRLKRRFGPYRRMPVRATYTRPLTPMLETARRRGPRWALPAVPVDGPFRRLLPAQVDPPGDLGL